MSGQSMRGLACGAALVVAVGAAVRATPASSDATRAAAVKTIWVGTVTVGYTRRYRFESGASEITEANIHHVSRADDTATVTGKLTVRNEYPRSCPTTHTVNAAGSVRTTPPNVTFVGQKYTVDYWNPRVTATITEQKGCKPTEVRKTELSVLPVGVLLAGTASPNAPAVSGSLKNDTSPCSTPTICTITKRATWSLRRVELGGGETGGGGPGGGGSPGSGAAPGTGCEDNVRNGTPGNDRLTGTARADLLRGLAGDDLVRGLGGHDCLWGHGGADELLGDLGNDILVGGPGVDSLNGGSGNDRVDSRDGTPETIRCGPGRDTARTDKTDHTIGCEQVSRQ